MDFKDILDNATNKVNDVTEKVTNKIPEIPETTEKVIEEAPKPPEKKQSIIKGFLNWRNIVMLLIFLFVGILLLAILSANSNLNQAKISADIEKSDKIKELQNCVDAKSSIQTDLTACQNTPAPEPVEKKVYLMNTSAVLENRQLKERILFLEEACEQCDNETDCEEYCDDEIDDCMDDFDNCEEDLEDCEDDLDDCEDNCS